MVNAKCPFQTLPRAQTLRKLSKKLNQPPSTLECYFRYVSTPERIQVVDFNLQHRCWAFKFATPPFHFNCSAPTNNALYHRITSYSVTSGWTIHLKMIPPTTRNTLTLLRITVWRRIISGVQSSTLNLIMSHTQRGTLSSTTFEVELDFKFLISKTRLSVTVPLIRSYS